MLRDDWRGKVPPDALGLTAERKIETAVFRLGVLVAIGVACAVAAACVAGVVILAVGHKLISLL